MDADDLLERLGEEAVGIVVPEVGLLGEGKLRNVLDGPDIRGLHLLLVKGLLVERHAVIDPLADPAQPLGLYRGHLLPRYRFFRTPVHMQLLGGLQNVAHYIPVILSLQMRFFPSVRSLYPKRAVGSTDEHSCMQDQDLSSVSRERDRMGRWYQNPRERWNFCQGVVGLRL